MGGQEVLCLPLIHLAPFPLIYDPFPLKAAKQESYPPETHGASIWNGYAW